MKQKSLRGLRFLLLPVSLVLANLLSAQPGTTPDKPIIKLPPKIKGYVDMHTHPVSQWGFGEQLFFGENDGDPAKALGSCGCIHNFVAPPFDGSCGTQNLYRNSIVDKIDKDNHINPVHSKVAGFPDFDQWPKHNSLLHQQMYVDWIKRAKEGGLRVMVALAVNSHALADAAETGGANDDQKSMNKQIEKMKAFFGRHKDFMEIAYSADQLRKIVLAGKLAVVLGIEVDNIGNFYTPPGPSFSILTNLPIEANVKNEIDRIYAMGVRYIFPVHMTNNVFGGTALYNGGLNVANKYNTGKAFAPEIAPASSGITFKLTSAFSAMRQDFFAGAFMGVTGPVLPESVMPDVLGNYPVYKDPGLKNGHRNSAGLTELGEFALIYMMKKGMMIDIDHMSEKSVDKALELATEKNYPLNSGHNSFRTLGAYNENARTDDQVKTIYKLGGMMGLGHGDHSTNFVKEFRYGFALTNGQPLALGTDVNGFYALPGKPTTKERIDYKPGFTKSTMGTKTWDFNEEGMSHYGLLPDYIESMKKVGMTVEELEGFNSAANRFANMWDKCETRAANFNNVKAEEEKTFIMPSQSSLCPLLVKGDREFGGHGPDINVTVTLKISADGAGVDAVIKMTAKETAGGDTEAGGTWTKRVYTAPGGTRILKINSELTGKAHVLSGGAGSEFGSCNEGLVYDSGKGQVKITGTLIKSIVVTGDTGGPDVTATANDCHCDTGIKKITFNEVSVTIVPL